FGVTVTVEIDGRFAYSWSNVDLNKIKRKPRKASSPVKRSARMVEMREAVRHRRAAWLPYALGEIRSAMNKNARKQVPKEMHAWAGPSRGIFDERLAELLDAIRDRDWSL